MQPEPLQTSANPLGTAPIGKLLPKFAIPSVIAFLVSSLYNIVDQIFIGQGSAFWAMPPPMWPFPSTTSPLRSPCS